jgi:hypothetical protein
MITTYSYTIEGKRKAGEWETLQAPVSAEEAIRIGEDAWASGDWVALYVEERRLRQLKSGAERVKFTNLRWWDFRKVGE